ncbi:MAG: TetR/AcrR family transcriptional regulator [Proteobacteria bacterium]|nr:TetR/AcrR family transcriptional regulator [Pseudomonadota bacterium]
MSKKQAILDAAIRLFAEKGFKDTPMVELSKMTGAAEGTIFYHFKNKEDLFLATLENTRDDIIGQFEQYAAGQTFADGLTMLEGFISFYLFLAGTMEDRFLLLHRHDAYEIAEGNASCRAYLEAIYNCLLDHFEQAIVRGMHDGSIDEVSSRKTSLILLSMIDGLARFRTFRLYDAGTLLDDLLVMCRKMLRPAHKKTEGRNHVA